MSFLRVKPPNWAVNEVVTSAQLNQLDLDHSNSLDKTVAGDQLAGVVSIAAAAMFDGNTAGTHFRASANGAKIAATVSGASIEANASGALVQATVAGALVKVTGGAVMQADVGSIPGDRYTFASGQTRNMQYPTARGAIPASGWSVSFVAGFPQLLGNAGTTVILIPFPAHNGATISQVTMYLQVTQPHANVPAVLPALNIVRAKNNAGNATSDLLKTSDQLFTPAPGSGAAWFNGGSLQSWTCVTNQNNVVDTTQYDYFVKLIDENGGNSLANNTYPWFVVQYTSILDLRFAT